MSLSLRPLAAVLLSAALTTPLLAAEAPAPAAPTAPAAQAPAAPAPAAPPPNENLDVNEVVGDWTVRCFKAQSPAPCDVMQAAINNESRQRVLSVSLAFVPSRDAYGMQIIVPHGVWLSKGLTLAAGDKTITGAKFMRCERDGCYVEMLADKDTVNALAAVGESTQVTITPYGRGESVNLPLSLKGFADARTKMEQLARQKAVNPPPAPAQPN